MLVLPIRDVVPITVRARLVRLDLNGHDFRYAAGQAVSIATHGVDLRKPYSIASAPEDAVRDGCVELLIGVNADGEAGAHLALAPGEPVDVEGPAGSFTFPERSAERDFVFVAGGNGIAPLRAMIRHAILARMPARHLGLLYSARTPDDFAFVDEFDAFAEQGAIDFRRTITRDAGKDWSGRRGRIDRAALSTLVRCRETLCFVCGPAQMVDDMPRLLEELGVARERIRLEEW